MLVSGKATQPDTDFRFHLQDEPAPSGSPGKVDFSGPMQRHSARSRPGNSWSQLGLPVPDGRPGVVEDRHARLLPRGCHRPTGEWP